MRIDNSRIFVADSYILQSQTYYKKAADGKLTESDIEYIKENAKPLSENGIYIKFGQGYTIFNNVNNVSDYYRMFKKEKSGDIDFTSDKIFADTPQPFMPGFVIFIDNIRPLTRKPGSMPAKKLYWLNYYKNAVADDDKLLKLDDFKQTLNKTDWLQDKEIKIYNSTYPLDKYHAVLKDIYWVICGKVNNRKVKFMAIPYVVRQDLKNETLIVDLSSTWQTTTSKRVKVADIIGDFKQGNRGQFLEILNSENVIKKYIFNHDNFLKREIEKYLNIKEYIAGTSLTSNSGSEFAQEVAKGVQLKYNEFAKNYRTPLK